MAKHGDWLFSGTLVDDKWKNDSDMVMFVKRGWVEMDPHKGFRITTEGKKIAAL